MILSVINKLSNKPLYVMGAFAGLFLPDIDLLLLPVLFHRTIITHSVLFVLLIKPFANKNFHKDYC